MIRFFQLITFQLLVFAALQVHAADVIYRAGTSIAQYDNVRLEVDPESSETSGSLYAGITVFEDNASFFTNLEATIATINYRNDIVADQNVADLSANLIWRIRPGQFEWYLNDTFAQTAIDTTAGDSIINRQDVNVFSTGPNYVARLNSRNDLQFEARAEKYQYELDLDNVRAVLVARWVHNVNAAFTLTLNNETEATRFDSSNNVDFDRNDLFLSVEYQRGVNAFVAEYGNTTIDNKSDIDVSDIDVGRYLFSFSSQRTQTSTFRMTYQNIVSDTGSQIQGRGTDGSIDNSTNNSATNDLFLDKLVRFQIINSLSKGNVIFEIGGLDRAYALQTELDVISKTAIISGAWSLHRASALTYNFRYVNRQYQDPSTDRVDDDYIYTLNYSYGLLRDININFEVTSQERQSNQADGSYEDLRFILSLNYTSS